MNLAFWRSGKQRDREVHAPGYHKPKVFRPWQLRQWLGLGDKGKKTEFRVKVEAIESLQTRQRRRAAFRKLSFENVNANYGPEPRHARRSIALKLAQRAYREHMKTQ